MNTLERLKRLAAPTTRLAIALLATLVADAVWAAKPVAVWDGDFTSLTRTVGSVTYTLAGTSNGAADSNNTIQGDANSGQYIQINGSSGIKVTSNRNPFADTDGSTKPGFTAIMRYSNYANGSSTVRAAMISFFNNKDYLGLANEANKGRGIWDGGYWNDNRGITSNTIYPTSSTDSQTVVASRFLRGATDCAYYVKKPDGTFSSGSFSGLTAGFNIGGVGFGGPGAGFTAASDRVLSVAKGMKIHSIMLFQENLSNDDIGYWALTGMGSKTIGSGGTIPDESTTGVTLNGGTLDVTADTTIKALFVQANTTLNIPASTAKLTVNGPIYVADGCSLTVNITSLPTLTEQSPSAVILGGNTAKQFGNIVVNNQATLGEGCNIYSSENGLIYRMPAIWENGTWSYEPPEGGDVVLKVNGSTTFTPGTVTSFGCIYVHGSGTLSSSSAISASTIDLESSSITVVMDNITVGSAVGDGLLQWSSNFPTTVPQGPTYKFIGSNDSASPTAYASAITVYGKLETSGYLDLSGANKIATTGELKVLDGSTKMNAGENGNGICGTLTIESGAEFVNSRASDALNYGGTPTVNVYGTLDMASTRWTLGTGTLNFYAGSTIEGAGHATNGALDSNSAKTFNVLAKDGQDTVNLSATLRLRTAQTFSIAAGVTVNCTGKDSNEYSNNLSITGSGKFKIATGASFNSKVTFNVATTATLELAGGTIASAIKGAGNLSVASGTYEPSFSSFTGPISVSGSGTVLTLASSQITASSGITVGTGSTLKIKVTDEVIATGFDASSKVTNSGGTVMFVNSSGTQITENVSQDGETLNPATKVLYWDGSSWSENDDFTGYTEASIAVSGATSVTLPASLNLQKMTLTGSSGSLTIVGNNNTLTVGDIVIPNGVTLNAASALTVTGDISCYGDIVVPSGVTFINPSDTEWYFYNSQTASGCITVETGGIFIVNGLVEFKNSYERFYTGLMIEESGSIQVNSTGTLKNWDTNFCGFVIAGSLDVQGNGTVYNFGQFDIDNTGRVYVSALAAFQIEAYDINNEGVLTLGKMRKLNINEPSTPHYIVNTAAGQVVFAATDAYIGEAVSDMTTIIGGSGTPALTFDVSNLTSLPTGTDATTLLTTSAIVPSLTGCSTDYYVKQDATSGAVTLQLHAAKDSEGLYYDDVADAFDAIVADHSLTVTILDGTEGNYSESLASKRLGRNGTKVFCLAAERLNIQGTVIGQYPTAQAAIDADNGDSIVAIYEASTVTPILTSLYIKPVGITLGDITINSSYAGYSYVMPDSDMSAMGLAGVYNITRNIAPATFTWNPEVSEGDWSDVGNWTSEDGLVLAAPNNSLCKVVLDTVASITVRAMTVGRIEVGAAVTFVSEATRGVTLTASEGIFLTADSATITTSHSGSGGGTYVELSPAPGTTLSGKYVKETKVGNETVYTTTYAIAAAGATIYDAEDNEVGSFGTLAEAIAQATDGQKVKLFADSSESITLNNKSIIFDEGDSTFSGSFTGNGTLTLAAMLKSPSADRWNSSWTGTVVLPAITSGEANFNNYGRVGSTVRVVSMSGGYLPDAAINPAIDIPEGGTLVLSAFSPSRPNTFNKLTGSGTLTVPVAADSNNDLGNAASWGSGYNYSAYLLVKDVSGFTGSLTANSAVGIAIGAEKPHKNTVGGKIIVKSDASESIASGKTWTAGTIQIDGMLTLASGGALSGTLAGSGTLEYEVAPNSGTTSPSFDATLWTGTVEFPEFSAEGIKLAEYGTSNSKIKINGITSGYLMWENQNVQAEVVLDGDLNITATSHRNYTYAHMSGNGSFRVSNSNAANADPNSIVITKLDVAAGSVGMAVVNNTTTTLNISTLALPADAPITPDTKLLSTGGTGNISITGVTVGGTAVTGLTYERRNNGGEGDGYYVVSMPVSDAENAAAGTISKDGNDIVANLNTTGNAVTLPDAVTKLTLCVQENSGPANITAVGVAQNDVVVKYGETVTTGAYLITKTGSVISFALNPSGSVGGNSVTPALSDSAPIGVAAAGAPTLGIKAVPGLWYALKSSDTPNGTFTAEANEGAVKQADGSSVSLTGGAVTTVKYYKISVGTTQSDARNSEED